MRIALERFAYKLSICTVGGCNEDATLQARAARRRLGLRRCRAGTTIHRRAADDSQPRQLLRRRREEGVAALRLAGAAFGGGEITVNQMYVQYQIPMQGERHVPVVMVHGCCLSSKTWETTPDGRMGWDEYFVRQDRSVYLADQVSRARSGFDSTRHRRGQERRAAAERAAEHHRRQAIRSRGRCFASARASARRFPTASFRSKRSTSSTSR